MYGLKNAPEAYSDHFMGILAQLGSSLVVTNNPSSFYLVTVLVIP